MESLPPDRNSAPRPAREADAAALARLALSALPLGFGEADFRREIAKQAEGAAAVWVSVSPTDELLAGAVIRRVGDEAELLWIAVDRVARRRGLGRELLAAALAWVDDRAATLFLEVRESNAPAIALYGGAGFVVVGRRARYYRDGEDALLFRRPASQPGTNAPADTTPPTPGEPR